MLTSDELPQLTIEKMITHNYERIKHSAAEIYSEILGTLDANTQDSIVRDIIQLYRR